MNATNLGYSKQIEADTIDEAVEKVSGALKENGFGVITEIDVQKTVKTKLDLDVLPYRILGACNPKMAHQVLKTDPFIGLLLPCNVILFENQNGGFTVSFAKPSEMFKLIDNPEVEEAAKKVDKMIRRAFELL